jgi:hypothetical protein
MACNFEYIHWYIETLHGFPYNYQILYSSYITIGALAEAIARLWMQRKHLYDHVSYCTCVLVVCACVCSCAMCVLAVTNEEHSSAEYLLKDH